MPASASPTSALPLAAQDAAKDALFALFLRDGRMVAFQRDEILGAEQDRAGQVYLLLSGVVRSCAYTEAGERQIFDFARPGDLIGFPDLDRWHCNAEACCRVRLLSLPAKAFDDALARDPDAWRAARGFCLQQLARRERHLVRLTKLRSEDRVLAFLTEFAADASPAAPGARDFDSLPLTRQEIGDHLGMTMETVCRAMTSLRRKRVIETDGISRYRLTPDEDGGRRAA